MEAVALSGMELTLVPPWMVPRLRVVLGFSGSGVRATVARAMASAAMGLGVPASVKLWPPGPLMVTWKRRLPRAWVTAESAPGAIEDDVGGDATGEGRLLVEMADAAQIAFAFFAYVAEHDDGSGELNLGVDDGLCKSKHADDAGSVVAGAGSGEAVGAVVASQDGTERRGGGEDGIEMRGEDDDGAGAVGGKMCRGDESDDVAEVVGVDVGETDFGEAFGDPL